MDKHFSRLTIFSIYDRVFFRLYTTSLPLTQIVGRVLRVAGSDIKLYSSVVVMSDPMSLVAHYIVVAKWTHGGIVGEVLGPIFEIIPVCGPMSLV